MLTTDICTDYQWGERDFRAPNIRPVTKNYSKVPILFFNFLFLFKEIRGKDD